MDGNPFIGKNRKKVKVPSLYITPTLDPSPLHKIVQNRPFYYSHSND